MFLRNGRSDPFRRLVAGLKDRDKTCTVIESSCGGLINSSIMAVPGSSKVFFGGSVAYNTRRSKKLLLNDSVLHSKLLEKPSQWMEDFDKLSEEQQYVRSKMKWTAETAKAFCEQMKVDYAIAEGGATGPTFRQNGLDKGFAVIAIAGRDKQTGVVKLLAQKTIRSKHCDRQQNMALFADAAAKLAGDTIGILSKGDDYDDQNNRVVEEESWLDRSTKIRSDKMALEQLENRSDAKYVVLRHSNESLFCSDSKLAFLPSSCISSSLPKTFLGLDRASDTPIFAVDIDETNHNLLDLSDFKSYYFQNTRTHAPFLAAKDNEIALIATAMSQWRRSHKFCSSCGKPLVATQGGTCLECTGCKSLSWPRQDPSIIVLVTNRQGTKALLARSSRHPKKVHTVLAGFVEAGETFEKTVMREVYEETGARVDPDSINYISSQPWPFPRSSMIGFRCTADHCRPLNVDTDEIVCASWFDKSEVHAAAQITGVVMNKDVAEKILQENPSLSLLIPPKGVIARSLIENWLEGG